MRSEIRILEVFPALSVLIALVVAAHHPSVLDSIDSIWVALTIQDGFVISNIIPKYYEFVLLVMSQLVVAKGGVALTANTLSGSLGLAVVALAFGAATACSIHALTRYTNIEVSVQLCVEDLFETLA